MLRQAALVLALAAAMASADTADTGNRQHVLQANLAIAGRPAQPVPYTQVVPMSARHPHHRVTPALIAVPPPQLLPRSPPNRPLLCDTRNQPSLAQPCRVS